MFVSSYNTYISTNNSEKIANKKIEKTKEFDSLFESKLAQNSVIESKENKNLPINYISNYKAFSNKQKLQEQMQDLSGEKYTKINAIKNAKDAYAENSMMFSLFVEPKVTLSQTPQIDKKLPTNFQEAEEKMMRNTMVNTYLDNDKYYQITA